MNRYTLQERAQIVCSFLRNNQCMRQMRNEFRARFPGRPLPDGRTVRRLINRFESSGTVQGAPRSGRPSVRNEEFVESVRESVRNAPSTSTRKRAAQLRASRTTLRSDKKLLECTGIDFHASDFFKTPLMQIRARGLKTLSSTASQTAAKVDFISLPQSTPIDATKCLDMNEESIIHVNQSESVTTIDVLSETLKRLNFIGGSSKRTPQCVKKVKDDDLEDFSTPKQVKKMENLTNITSGMLMLRLL
uniref:Putative dd41d transposase n=1 Tax=Lutzomyia longipalpis TaxID=7200 RepID=A0A1B0CMP1_LUTLO